MDEFYELRYKMEARDQWRESIPKIPFLKFPADWQVQIIPPFGGLMARFRMKLPSGMEKSIYLDFYDRAGYVGQPYWEVYPYQGDCGRALLKETDELLRMIGDESESPSEKDG